MAFTFPKTSTGRGAVSGVATLLVGYLLTLWGIGPNWAAYVRAKQRGAAAFTPPPLAEPVHAIQVFLYSHVTPVGDISGGGFASHVGPDPLVYGVVLAGLMVAGFWTAYGSKGRSNFREGAQVVYGYLPSVALGAIAVVVWIAAFVGRPGLDLLVAIVVAGIVFPVVFGGIGGFVAAEYEYRTRDETDTGGTGASTSDWR